MIGGQRNQMVLLPFAPGGRRLAHRRPTGNADGAPALAARPAARASSQCSSGNRARIGGLARRPSEPIQDRAAARQAAPCRSADPILTRRWASG